MSVVFHPSCQALPGLREQVEVRAERLRWLRGRVAAIEGISEPQRGGLRLSLGAAELDRALDGGLEAGALHEIFPANAGAHAASLWFAAMLAAQMPGPMLWCTGYRDMFPPGLATAGLAPGRILYARASGVAALLSSMEEGLGAVRCIVGELGRDLPMAATRRLQLAAARSLTLVLLVYRPQGRETFVPTAAASRWRLGVLPSAGSGARVLSGAAGLGKRRLRLDLLRLRGSGLVGPQSWKVEVCDGPAGFALVADLANRSVAPRRSPGWGEDWRLSG